MRPKTHPWNHLLSGDLGMFAATFPRTAERIKDAIYSAIEQDQHAALRAEVEAKQARIDALMLEHSPDEMTPEQLAEWAQHQKPAPEGA